ncbi:MAG TPA: MinD/ParA family protein [Thermodesulfobacteriaceae bacterium]|nr:MinD/ParA family protein [Thermodesulfobacteriaceae bacterium]
MNQAQTLREWKINGNMAEFHRNSRHLQPEHCPMVLSFSSGKGGVGKTSVVTNLAVAMADQGKRVMILDADLGLANVDVMLGLTPKYTTRHVFTGEKNLEEILIQGPGGILILPAGSGIPELLNLNESEKLFLLNEIEELGPLVDVLLVDTAAGISDNVIYFNMATQQRIIVVTPEPTSITDAYALIKVLANQHHIKKFSILVNWARNGREAHRVYRQLSTVADRFLGLISLDYLGCIPRDDAIPRAVCRQKTVLEMYPDCKASKGFIDLSKTILNVRSNNHVDGNIKFFWKHLLGA